MSLLQDSQIQNSVYLCSFQCTIRQANISMKFPCSYFVEWSTSSRKAVATSSKHLPDQNVVHFDQKLILQTQMVYNNKISEYSKKETLVQLYLISKSRPDQNKLVGRVSIDLAKVINFEMYAQPTQFTLNFCSVQGSITMQFHLIDQRLTTMKMQDLDKSSFIDFISQIATKNPKNNNIIKPKQILHKQKQFSTTNKDVAQLKMSLRNDIIDLQKNIASNHLNGSQIRNSNNLTNQRLESRNINLKNSIVQIKSVQQQRTDSKIIENGVDLEVVKPKISFKFKPTYQTNNNKNQELQTFALQNRNSQPLQTFQNVIQREQIIEIRDDKQQALQLQTIQRHNQVNIQQEVVEVIQQDANMEIKSLKQQRNMLEKIVIELQQKQKNANKQIQYLKQQIGTKNKIINQLQSELNQKDHKSEQLLHMVQSLSQQKAQKQGQEQNRKQSENELLYFQDTIKKFQIQIKQLNFLLQEALTRQIKNQKKFYDLQQLIKTLQFQNNKYKDQLRNQLHIRQALQSKIIYYEVIVKQLTKANQQNQIKLIQSQENYQKSKIQLQSYEKQHRIVAKQFLQKIEVLKQELEKVNQFNLTIQTQNQQYTQICNQRQTQLLQFKILFEQYKKKEVNTSRSVQVIQNTEKIIELKQQNKRISEQVQFLKQSLQMLQRQNNQEIEMLKNQKNKIEQTCLKLKAELQKFNLQYEERQNYDTQRQIGMQQVLSNVNKEINAYKEQLNKMDNQLAIQKQCNEEMIFQIKSLQNQKNSLIQQLQNYQGQIVSLHQQMREIGTPITNKNNQQQSYEEKIYEYQIRISKLNTNLQEQINYNTELSQTIVNYMQKQAKMKETLTVLQQESKEIFVLFQEKEHNEETYQKMIQGLQKQIQTLSTNFYQIHSEESSPRKNLENSPSLNRLKQKMQSSTEELTQTNRKLQQLNEQLNEELLKLKIMYNRLKQQSEGQIKKLNEQISETSNSSKKDTLDQKHNQLEKELKAKDLELQISKFKLKQTEQVKIKVQKQLEEIRIQMEILEEEKFNIESAYNQKDIRILQLSQEILILKNITETTRNQSQPVQKQNEEFIALLNKIKQTLTNRNINPEWEQFIQNILQKSLSGQETAKLINIEQKSRLLSKQLQKLKAQILKSALKNQQQKLLFMNLIKKCESIVVEIISAAESLNLNQSSFL